MRQPSVVILGLGDGLAAACARRFNEEKWLVLLADNNAEALNKAGDDIAEDITRLHADTDTNLGINNCLAACLEAHGHVDTVIRIAPNLPTISVFELDEKTLQSIQNRIINGLITTITVFSEYMVDTDQHPDEPRHDTAKPDFNFLHILPISAIATDQQDFCESAMQGSALAIARAASVDLAIERIRSNCVIPLRQQPNIEAEYQKHRTPLKRMALDDEIADAALFLASAKARFITGQELVLDGGRSRLNTFFKHNLS